LKGRHDEALDIFKRIYSLNTGKDPDTYPVIDTCMVIFYLKIYQTVILMYLKTLPFDLIIAEIDA